MAQLIACPCCGYRTIVDSYDICTICRWEHDPAQEQDPDSDFGANHVSLREGQKNFEKLGVCDPAHARYAASPDEDEERDPNWKPLS